MFGGQRTSSLFKKVQSMSTSVPPLYCFDRHLFRRHSLAVAWNWLFHCIKVPCSCVVICNAQGRPKTFSSSQLKINKANAASNRLISKWQYLPIKTYSINKTQENFILMWWVLLSLRKLQTANHWQNRLFLTLESLTFQFAFHWQCITGYKQKSM